MVLVVTSLLLVVFLVGTCTPQDSQVILELTLKNLIDGHIKILQKLDEQETVIRSLRDQMENCSTRAQVENSATRAQVENTATRAQVEQCATRAQVENCATRAQVENCATRVQVENFATRAQVDAFKTTFVTEQEDVKNSLQMCSTKEQIITFQDLLGADECDEGSHNCSASATCTDSILSFKCSCRQGFWGDGFTCQDIDECRENNTVCGDEQLCTNLPGNYSCSCNKGYKSEGDTCQDINECQSGVHACHVHATCTNNIGNYTCECLPAFDGDGYTCNVSDCQSPSQVIPGLGCVTPVKEKMTWDQAKDNCHTKGLRLLEGIRREHLQPLKHHFEEYLETAGTDARCWMGFRGGVWLKSKDVPVAEDEHWNAGDPNGSEQNKNDCGKIYLNSHKPYLYDWTCSVPDFSSANSSRSLL